MDSQETDGNGTTEALPPPPPVPEDVVPEQALQPVKKKVMRVPMARRGLATKGQKVQLLTNHFKVSVSNVDGHFFHYSVALFYEDGRPVDGKGVGRKVLDRVHETYDSELAGKEFAYDGEKSLFTIGALPRNKLEFTVVLEDVTSNRNNGNASPDHGSPNDKDKKRIRRQYQSKTFKVELSFAAKIPMQAIAQALRGQESENSQEALRVLDIILRQHAARQGCLLVRQSFFHNDVKNFADVGGGVLGCRGFHSSFRTSQGGLSLNIDVSTTMIIQPGPVVDFLISNQNVKDPYSVDWAKAKRTLKNLRMKTSLTNQEYKITGLSERPCNQQLFSLKQKSKNENGEPEMLEVTVYDYFVNYRKIDLRYSGDLPCINVGRPKRPTYFPLELCSLVSLQRYTKALSTLQRSSLVEKSRQKPQERMRVLSDALKLNNYDAEPLLKSCGISINSNFTQVEGRVLPAPRLKVGNGEDFFPRNGRWNFNNKKLVDPVKIEKWAVVNFSARCDIRNLVKDLIKCGALKGIKIDEPFDVFEESPQNRRAPPLVRVEKMFEYVQSKLPGAPQFFLCLLPERKNSDLYGPWKRKNLAEFGIVTQCIAPMRVNDQYLTNVLLKINAKLGGLNSMLAVEHTPSIPIVSKAPTIILGMDVSHGSPGQSDVPSIAAVVSSRHWPLISRYRASVRTQSPKVEMIDSLFKKVSDTEDDGIMRELLLDFYVSSGKQKPDQIIIFRDGVSESQFNQVLNIELDQIIEACKFLDEKWCPKFLVIIAQKNHHTKFCRMWGSVTCYSYMTDFQDNPSLLMDFVEAIDRLLTVNSELPRRTWETLIGAGLVSYQKLGFSHDEIPMDRFLYFAKKYKLSIHILSAVADFLDSFDASTIPADGSLKKYHPELEAGKTVDAFDVFSENLFHSDKRIRLLTLRILCHFESLTSDNSPNNENVLHLLLAIESTYLSIATSRKVILLITKIQMDLSTGRIHSSYIPLVLNSIIGIFHNQFNYLWNPAMECFAVLVSSYQKLVWEICMKYLENCVSNFISHQEHSRNNSESSDSPDDLVSCFNAAVGPPFDDVASPTVLSLLIKSLQKVPIVVESRSRQVIPLFLKFLGYDVDDLLSVRSYNLEASKGKSWKGVLEEWLNLLKSLHNPKSFYRTQFLKDVLQYRLLDENDPELQMKVLDCLLNWKDEYLLPYSQNLRNLVNPKTLRDELTRWSVSRDSNLVNEEHRDSLVPLVIRLLVPKVRKLKTLASRKAASMHHRKAVIAFLAKLDINELPLFFALLIKPLQTGSSGVDDVDELLWGPPKASTSFDSSGVLRHFTMDNIRSLSSKKIYGFLHVTEEILGVFDESRINPVLDTLMGSVVRILASCACSMDVTDDMCVDEDSGAEKQAMTNLAPKHFKDLRSLCLKIISLVLSKFENHDFSLEFWDIFFSALKPLIDGFKQEGASSDKPSSLFVCFLAMSRSPKLVSLFHRAKNLVPDIFSILTVTTASEAIISCVLRFIENLLNLDDEVESDDTGVKGVLLPNIDTLVCSLHHLFTSKSTNRKSLKYPGGRELNIFKLLPKYIQDPSIGKKFVDILLPSLTKKHHDWDSCVETLRVIQKMVPMLGSEGSSRILKTISPLLIHATTDVRLAICDILDALHGTDPSLLDVAKLLREFNAVSPMEIDVLDYDVILGAYQKINIEFFCNVPEDQALAILSHCIHDMSSQDLVLRDSAYRLLLLFLDFCNKILSGDLAHSTGGWPELAIQNTVNHSLLKYMGEAMDKETSVKKVWMDLLREMALKLPQVSNLESYQALSSVNAEQDFFNNIVHLQKHRRAKALSRLCGVVRVSHLSDTVTNKVIVPLLFNMLLEVKDGKGEHLRNSCIEALASVSSSMQWKQYYTLLNRCFRELKLKPDRQKLFLRLIYAILENYHFASDLDTQTSLQTNILPKIQKLLTLDTEKVNVNISLVALKLLKLLPGNILELQLPTIIHRVSNFLKDRLDSVRDEARSALSACLKELGLEYLQFVVKILRSTLKRGFEVHVLGYTLNFILSKLLSGPNSGILDYCLEEILQVAENDILGDVSDEKEVEMIASKMKETRKKKSFETLKLVAQSVTFKTHALKLMSPVTRHLQSQSLTPKLKSKLETMLQHIALGIECNPTVDQKDVLVFVYGLIDDDISGKTKTKNTQCSHLVTIFALGILHNRIKKMKIKENEEESLSLLDPFVGLLCSCLTSKYEDITSTALRCLSLVVKIPLPSLNSQSHNIKTALFTILHGSVKATTPLAESCLRLLTVLLKSTSITLSNDQMHMLLQFPLFVDIERNPSFVALSLLKAIVNRKVVVPEIYDLAKQVAEVMVTSQVGPVRKKCSQIFLQFLLDYSLSQKRLQQHLDFLLSNLRYEHSTGREAVLEMLHAIIMKFPPQIVNEQSQTLFLQLVVCLANDCEKNVRSMTGAAIKLLIGRVSPQSLNCILEYTLFWYSGEKQGLWSAAAQVLGLLVEVMKKGFGKHIDAVFPVMRRILPSAVKILKNDDHQDPSTVPLWKEAYYSLVLFEKILVQFPEMCLGKDLEDIWEIISDLLLHPHMWLRNISNRLISLYFITATESIRKNGGEFLLMRPSRLFLLAVSFCSQLKASLTDDSANNYLKQNIVFSILGLHSILGQEKEALMFWSSLEQKDEEVLIKAFMILDSRKGRSMFASLASGLDGLSHVEDIESHRYLLISSLLKRMGKLALDMEEVQMRIVFDSFRQISPKLLKKEESDSGQTYAYQVVLPLYKICEGFAGKVISEDVKQFAQEVRDSIKAAMGMEEFVKVYSLARKNLKAKRDKRRQSEKVMAVVNPMRNAKRKLRIAAKHKQNKKRKIMTMKFGRWVQ